MNILASPSITISQSDITIRIERLVRATERHNSDAFRIKQTRSGRERIETTRLSRYFDHIQQMFNLFDDRYAYDYSEHLQVFREACQDVGLENSSNGLICLNQQRTAYLDHHRSMNVLVGQIRYLTRQKQYQRKEGDRRQQARKNEASVAECVKHVMQRYYRTLVIRVDLYYLKSARTRLQAEDVFDDLNSLVRAVDRSSVFDHEIGYICRVEQGEDMGFHIHAAFFFNGSEVSRDRYKASQIGELWKQLTRGYGYFHSCNHNKEQYDEVGIGMFERLDAEGIHKVISAMHYLTEDGQHLRIKPKGAKALRIGGQRY